MKLINIRMKNMMILTITSTRCHNVEEHNDITIRILERRADNKHAWQHYACSDVNGSDVGRRAHGETVTPLSSPPWNSAATISCASLAVPVWVWRWSLLAVYSSKGSKRTKFFCSDHLSIKLTTIFDPSARAACTGRRARKFQSESTVFSNSVDTRKRQQWRSTRKMGTVFSKYILLNRR